MQRLSLTKSNDVYKDQPYQTQFKGRHLEGQIIVAVKTFVVDLVPSTGRDIHGLVACVYQANSIAPSGSYQKPGQLPRSIDKTKRTPLHSS